MIKKTAGILLLLLLFSPLLQKTFYESNGKEKLIEEANPIREDGIITGLEYTITIQEETDDDKIIFSTHILDSILHYKSIENIESFSIDLKIENNSNNSYSLKKISLVNTINFIEEDILYVNTLEGISFVLSKDVFERFYLDYEIKIEFDKT